VFFVHQFIPGFQPDNTTVFQKKGDLLSLGELVLPADAVINIKSSQVLVGSAPTAAAAAAGGNDPYLRAQQWLNGFVSDVVNTPVVAAVRDEPEGRTKGSMWTVPRPKTPSCEQQLSSEPFLPLFQPPII
jgi:hypothetical protein